MKYIWMEFYIVFNNKLHFSPEKFFAWVHRIRRRICRPIVHRIYRMRRICHIHRPVLHCIRRRTRSIIVFIIFVALVVLDAFKVTSTSTKTTHTTLNILLEEERNSDTLIPHHVFLNDILGSVLSIEAHNIGFNNHRFII